MLAVQVELLTGRYVASRFNDRNRAEWPPHPARLFFAAVAAWADADEPDEGERAALRWWEEQGDPFVTCSWGEKGYSERASVIHYVPVNDTQVVGRDLSTTYLRLRAAIDAVDAARVGNARDPKALAKAEQVAVKLLTKATGDSAKASSVGRAPASALGLLPESRLRQARVYPTTVPSKDYVAYRWSDADEHSPHVSFLDGLLARIARVGHSSSFVAVSVIDADQVAKLVPNERGDLALSVASPGQFYAASMVESDDLATLVPDERGDIGLRVASPGQFDALEAAFASHHGTDPRILPALVTGYSEAARAQAEPLAPVFGPNWLLLELVGRARFTIRDTLALARAVRGALLYHADQDPVPEIISGHASGADRPTSPTTRPHLAVVPLPFAGHTHADGRVRAVALVLPTDVGQGEAEQVRSAVRRWLADGRGQLNLGTRGSVVELIEAADAPTSARPDRWCDSSRRWLSVTPIALDRNPGNLRHAVPARRKAAARSAADTVAAACVNIGLPAPVRVTVHTDPLLRGSAPIRSFPKYAVQGGRLQRVLLHAALEFGEPVSGPMLLGAGRYHGYGLCSPADRSRVKASRG